MVEGAAVREALIEVIAFPFYGTGWLVGLFVQLGAFCRDAIIAGYQDGRK